MKIKILSIVDSKGKRVAVQLPITIYNKLLEVCEELNDISAYDRVKKQGKFIPFVKVLPK